MKQMGQDENLLKIEHNQSFILCDMVRNMRFYLEHIANTSTPWKIHMVPKHHLFEKKNHLPNLYYYVQF